MKIRHYKLEHEAIGKCPVTDKKSKLICGTGDINNPDIIIEREYQDDFILYHVTYKNKKYQQDEALVLFIGERSGKQVVELSIRD